MQSPNPLPNFIFPQFSFFSPKLHSSANISTRKIFSVSSLLACFLLWFSLFVIGITVALFFECTQIQFSKDTSCIVSDSSPILNETETVFFFKATISWGYNYSNHYIVDKFCKTDSESNTQECMQKSKAPYDCVALINPIYSNRVLSSSEYGDFFTTVFTICCSIFVIGGLISLSLQILLFWVNKKKIPNPIVSINWENPDFQCISSSKVVKGFAEKQKGERSRQLLTCELMIGEEIQLYEYADVKPKNLFFIISMSVCFIITFILSAIVVFFPVLPVLVFAIIAPVAIKLFEDHYFFKVHYLLTNRRIIIFRPRLFNTFITCVELRNIKNAWVNGDVVESFGLMVVNPVDVAVEFQDGERGILLESTIASAEYLNSIQNQTNENNEV